MNALTTTTRARIFGTAYSWRFTAQAATGEPSCECDIQLEIQGDSDSGYLLIISPAGFFTADTWHDTLEAAQDRARDLLGVAFADWTS